MKMTNDQLHAFSEQVARELFSKMSDDQIRDYMRLARVELDRRGTAQ